VLHEAVNLPDCLGH